MACSGNDIEGDLLFNEGHGTLNSENKRLRVHLFACNKDTLAECLTRNLFGDREKRSLEYIQVDDFALLYNYTTKQMSGIWKIIEIKNNLIPEAWGGEFPNQARVIPVLSPANVLSLSEIRDLVLNSKKKMMDYLDGPNADTLISAFGFDRLLPTVPNQPNSVVQKSKYHVQFFDEITMTQDWKDFEDYTHDLLRLLGILNLHEIPRARQAGRSDGYFKMGRLAVVYDATLNESRDEFKAQQVANYIYQLKAGMISLPLNQTESVQDCKKRVWIITRGKTGFQRKEDDVQVSEVAVIDLIHLYIERLTKKMDAEQLEEALTKLGGRL